MENYSGNNLSEIIYSLGEDRNLYFNSIAPPIVQTSNFKFNKVADFTGAIEDEYSTYIYSRGRNPTVDILKEKLAAMDGAEDCLVVNSGSTAIFASVLSQVQSGDHIITVRGVYSWAQKMFDKVLPRFGVTTTYIDGRNIKNFEAAIRPETRLIYLESPTSWVFEEQDLPAVASLAKANNIVTVIDNTYFTPLYQQPLGMGIDIAIQSASKYINGHSDAIAGVICASHSIIQKIFHSEFLNIGAGIQPFNAWLLLRGLRTLPIRLEKIRQTTARLKPFFESHPAVDHLLAPKNGFGLLTIVLKTPSREAIIRFCETVDIPMAVSWGGYESLVLPRCAGIPDEVFDAGDRFHKSVRIYLGLEEPEYLIEKFEKGFALI